MWVGGRLTGLASDHLELKEAVGSVISLRRLGGNATSFYRVVGGAWQPADPRTEVRTGTRVCVETLMDGQTLLALRVFLGADCGPAA